MMRIQIADLEAIVRLTSESAALSDIAEAKRHLFDGVAMLIDADSWFWLWSSFDVGTKVSPLNFLSGGRGPALDQGRVMSSLFDFDEQGIKSFERLPPNCPHTCSRVYLTDVSPWTDLTPAWVDLGIEDCLISVVRLGECNLSAWGLIRRWPARYFSHRERYLVDLTMRKVSWLHRNDHSPVSGACVETLSPRRQAVLRHLLQGDNQRTVARKLGISGFTVRDIIKEIYQHFNVSTLGELHSLAINGDLRFG